MNNSADRGGCDVIFFFNSQFKPILCCVVLCCVVLCRVHLLHKVGA